MLRFARFAGPELAQFYTFTGKALNADDLVALKIVSRLVAPEEVEDAVKDLAGLGPREKYRKPEIPDSFKPFAGICSKENIRKFFIKEPLETADHAIAEKFVKILGFKAPKALAVANEIIDAQQGSQIGEAVEIELGRLEEMFTTRDALEGLSSAGRKRPEFKGE